MGFVLGVVGELVGGKVEFRGLRKSSGVFVESS